MDKKKTKDQKTIGQTLSNTHPTKIWGWSRVIRKGNLILRYIPTRCVTPIQYVYRLYQVIRHHTIADRLLSYSLCFNTAQFYIKKVSHNYRSERRLTLISCFNYSDFNIPLNVWQFQVSKTIFIWNFFWDFHQISSNVNLNKTTIKIV